MKRILALLPILAIAACGNKKIEYKDKMYAEIVTNHGTMKVELWHDKAPKTVENFIGLAMGTKEWTNPKSGAKSTDNFYDGLIFHRVIKDFMIQGGCPVGNGTGGPGFQFEDECYDTAGAKEIADAIATVEEADLVLRQLIVPYLRSTPDPNKELLAVIQERERTQSYDPIMKKPVSFFKKATGNNTPVMTRGALKAKVEYGTICMANSGPNTNGSQFFIVTKKDGCPWLDGKHTVFGKIVEGMDVAEKIQSQKTAAGDKPAEDVTIKKIRVI